MSNIAPEKKINSPEKSNLEVCPECRQPAKVIGKYEIEGRITVITYECPNCHHFGKTVDIK